MFEQQSDPEKTPVKARANSLHYELKNDTVTLKNNASIEQSGTSVSGKLIEYNIGLEKVKASSAEDGSSRVHMILTPENND